MTRPPLPDAIATTPGEHGPIVLRIVEELAAAGVDARDAGVVERSPFGSRAVRLRLAPDTGIDVADTARRLASLPWVEVAVGVAPNLYLRPVVEAMRAWTLDGVAVSTGSSGRGVEPTSPAPRVTIVHADANALASGPLDVVRHVCTAHAIASLLRVAGCIVTTEEIAVDASHAFSRTREVLLRSADGIDVPIATAGVDLPQGSLRARYGGAIRRHDLIDLIDRVRGDRGGAAEAASIAVVSFLMLLPARGSRLKLDEARLTAAVEGLGDLTSLAQPADRTDRVDPRRAAGLDDAADALLVLDATAQATRRALDELEPSHLLRHLRGLALAAAGRLATDDPLRLHLAEVVAGSLAAVGIDPHPVVAPRRAAHR